MTSLACSNEFRNGDVLVRALAGSLDEQFDPRLFEPGGAKHLVLDCRGVTHVSSYGVREWIRVLKPLKESALEGLYFVNVSPRLTDQFNMVMGFDAGGSLLSFYTYYVCDECDEESLILFDTLADRAVLEAFEPPERQCQFCGAEAELDDDPSMLFEYVRGAEIAPPPAAVTSTLRDTRCWLNHLPGLKLSTRQSVQGDVTKFNLAGVIDESLSPRRMVQSAEGQTYLVLSHVQSLLPDGMDKWRQLVQGISNQTGKPVVISGAPPGIVRRFIDDPSLCGGAHIQSICLNIRCGSCRSIERRVVQLTDFEAFRSSPGACRACKAPLQIDSAEQLLEDFEKALPAIKQAASSVVPPPAPTSSPRERARKRKQARDEQPETAESKLFAGKYEVLSRFAQGGMAEVFVARQHGAMGFKRLAVIKSVRGELVTDDRMIRLFLDEAKLAARIDHPNVIRVYDLGREAGGFYMVLEYVHGRSLAQVVKAALRRGKALSPVLAATITAELCKGLARAHQPTPDGKVLVHRDITLANVLLSFDGVVKIVDFGLAGHDQIQWDHGTILGSPAWIAPEIYTGAQAHPGADIWGAGLILMVLLTGKHPFVRKTTRETAQAIVNDRIRRGWSNPIPRKLFNVIEMALAKNPKKRYVEAKQMEKDLRELIPRLGPAEDVAGYIQDLFKEELSSELGFARQHKASNFVEAMLNAGADDVESYFRSLERVKKAS